MKITPTYALMTILRGFTNKTQELLEQNIYAHLKLQASLQLPEHLDISPLYQIYLKH